MALTGKIIKRVELPHEPGQWITVRMPSMLIFDQALEGDHRWLTFLTACIQEWSYEEPVTPDNIGELDPETVRVLSAALNGTEPDDASKNAEGRSTEP